MTGSNLVTGGTGSYRSLRRTPFTALATLPLLLACGNVPDGEHHADEEDAVDAVEQEFVGTPTVQGPTTPNAMPLMHPNVSNVRGGSFLQGNLLSGAPKPVDINWAISVAGDPFLVAPAFANTVVNGGVLGYSGLDVYWSDNLFIDQILSWFDEGPVSQPWVPNTFGYPAERARWLSGEGLGPGVSSQIGAPTAYNELRQRGARLYCAAKTAYDRRPSGSVVMGRRSLGSVRVLGQRIDFMTIEPTVSMASPVKVDAGTNDGAQGYIIPLATGVRLTPISLLPSFPELRAPVVMFTGDSEVKNKAKYNQAQNRWEEWMTVSHADAFFSGNQVIAQQRSGPILLFYVGPVPIYGDFWVTLDIASCSQAKSMDECRRQATASAPVERLLAGIKLGNQTYPMPAGWPAKRTGGYTDPAAPDPTANGKFNDMAWVLNSGGTSAFLEQDSGKVINLPSNSPMGIRSQQDNDKSIEVRTGLTLGSEFSTGASVTYAPFTFSVGVRGSVSVTGAMVHSVREQQEVKMRYVPGTPEFGFNTPDPVTSLTVTPSSEAEFNFGTSGDLYIEIKDIPLIGTITKRIALWREDTDLPFVKAERWPEANRLRLTTALSKDGVLQSNPGSSSHWPRGSNFTSLSSSCMSGNPEPTELPAICKPKQIPPRAGGTSTAPNAKICAYYPVTFGAPDDEAGLRCGVALSSYARRGVTKRQAFKGVQVDAHVMRPEEVADRTALDTAIDTCADAYKNLGRVGAFEKVDAQVRFEPCDELANLHDWLMGPYIPTDDGPDMVNATTQVAPGDCY